MVSRYSEHPLSVQEENILLQLLQNGALATRSKHDTTFFRRQITSGESSEAGAGDSNDYKPLSATPLVILNDF